jgi:type VI secretion system FHA domain protein
MPLRLRIVSDHRRRLGERSSISFGLKGGTIGRSAENDWVLPDPQRYVSGLHARVVHRSDKYFLEDLSSNGTFLNDDHSPIVKRGPVALKSGDLIRLGEYEVMVAVEADQGDEALGASRIDALLTVPVPHEADLGASLNLQALLPPDSSPSDSFRPVNAFGQAIAAEPERGPLEDHEGLSALRRQAGLAKLKARQLQSRAANIALADDTSGGLQAFCRGAGLDPQRLPPDAHARLLHLAGLILREALVGLKDLDRAQHEARSRFGIEIAEPDDSRPALSRSTIEDLLIDVLSQHESRRIDALQWMRDSVERAKAHETSWEQAMRAAFIEFIRELDPLELDARFKQANWDIYRTFYRSLTEMSGEKLPHRFVEAFANVYREAAARKT